MKFLRTISVLCSLIQLKIVVQDTRAKLFLNGNSQPCLIVADLKLGATLTGPIGLWVDFGTGSLLKRIRMTGFLSDLSIYSALKFFTGLAMAARMALCPTVIQAMSMEPAIAARKIHAESSILYA